MKTIEQQAWGERLLAVCVLGLFASTAVFAPPAQPIPPQVMFQNSMYVNLLFASEADQELKLESTQGRDYEGCVCLKVVNSFPNVVVLAKIVPAPDIQLCESWWIRLNETGEDEPYRALETSNVISEVHSPSDMGEIMLCAKAKNVIAESFLQLRGGEEVEVAHILVTVMPNF